MSTMNIHTTMGAQPRYIRKKAIMIRRGATSLLNYSVYYDLDNIDQFKLVFDQEGTKYQYSMFDYFTETADTIAYADTIYYEKLADCKFRDLALDEGDEVPEGSYITYPLETGMTRADNTDWQIDSHFNYKKVSDSQYTISFMLTGDETTQFEVTRADEFVKSEYIIQYNTDNIAEFNGKDTIFIEPQQDIMIIDSLYRENSKKTDNTVSNDLVCSDDAVCV